MGNKKSGGSAQHGGLRHAWKKTGARQWSCPHCGCKRSLVKGGKGGLRRSFTSRDGEKMLDAPPSCVVKSGARSAKATKPARSARPAKNAMAAMIGASRDSGALALFFVPSGNPLMSAHDAATYLAFESEAAFLSVVESGGISEPIRHCTWLRSDLDAYVDQLVRARDIEERGKKTPVTDEVPAAAPIESAQSAAGTEVAAKPAEAVTA